MNGKIDLKRNEKYVVLYTKSIIYFCLSLYIICLFVLNKNIIRFLVEFKFYFKDGEFRHADRLDKWSRFNFGICQNSSLISQLCLHSFCPLLGKIMSKLYGVSKVFPN